MAKNSIDAYGASGKTNVLFFDPAALTLVEDPAHALYDERVHLPVDDMMARNIDYQGVLEPVAVSKNPETGAVEVVYGRQRVKATRRANEWRKARGEPPRMVPGIVYQGKRQNALDAIVSENETRTADTPLGRAEKMRRHMALGRGEDQLAVLYNCTVATVRNTLALLDCAAPVQKAVEAGQITVSHATALSKLAPDDQRAKVAELIEAGQDSTPHERSRKQAAIMGGRPRLKTRKEIATALKQAQGEYASALRWVLGEDAPDTGENHAE
ncbi:hypothetical protein D0838_04945 [Bordetella avium]|uniref:ParB/RepB/Spo0J family partition protein n=1 Tax=Bordetella avium TaxID=521 RepID=UPI000E691FFD|nr:ParB/RepB/Spo0J family partition protein [Bordetella avium]RIQ74549.1 hypothetical protein D0838_04945 [Bordetella avium]